MVYDVLTAHTYTCPVCGKEYFILNPMDYTYKIDEKKAKHYFCSYKCFRKYQKANPKQFYNRAVR